MAKKDKKNQLHGDGTAPCHDPMSLYGFRRETKKVKKREAVIRILLIILVPCGFPALAMFFPGLSLAADCHYA